MTYKIVSSRQFEKDFKKLDDNIQERVKSKIKGAAKNPERYKHMHHTFKGISRLRIGKLRIVFSYNVEKRILYLEKWYLDINMVGEDIVRTTWRHVELQLL